MVGEGGGGVLKGSSRCGDVGGGGCEVECGDSCCGRSGYQRRDTMHVVGYGHQPVGHRGHMQVAPH